MESYNDEASKCEEAIYEPVTNIAFPYSLSNEMIFVGCGVRSKLFINVYAVGTYIDKTKFKAYYQDQKQQKNDSTTNKHEIIQNGLSNPNAFPRTLRIVTNYSVSSSTLTSGIMDALRPRLKNVISKTEIKSLHTRLMSLNDGVKKLVAGTEVEMKIDGDTMYHRRKNSGDEDDGKHENGPEKIVMIQHKEFCVALCDVYYGTNAVSLDHRNSVIQGIMDTM
mmetsp:Transcript_8688/g.10969  ORF Transcript_8688/g.10969 Transcript_8688/m.10969 type:complete len:222 (+) Transcript_8688:48-713(+)